MKVGNHEIDISNRDKKLFPSGITKGDLIDYYDNISKKSLYFMKDRPLVMQRFPDNIKKGFYQKEVPNYFPKWINTVKVSKEKTKKQELVVCDNKATLIYLANQAVLTPHLWLSKKDNLRNPDSMIFDLDPSKDNFEMVKEGAKQIKKIMEKIKLKSFLKTTGSKGLHVVIPFKPKYEFSKIRNFAKVISEHIVEQNPNEFTGEHRKEKRKGRIFIDYLRNSYAQTAVSPYAVRNHKNAPVAAPVSWSELNKLESSQKYNIQNITKRKDPWKEYNHKQAIKEDNLQELE